MFVPGIRVIRKLQAPGELKKVLYGMSTKNLHFHDIAQKPNLFYWKRPFFEETKTILVRTEIVLKLENCQHKGYGFL